MGTPSGGMDIGAAASVTELEDAGVVVRVKDQNGEPYWQGDPADGKPVWVRIAGSLSKRYKKLQDEHTTRMVKKRQTTLTTDILTRNRLELVALCILEWSGFVSQGQPFPLTPTNAMVLVGSAEWIYQQLAEAQNDHEGFTGTASGS